MLIHLQLHLQLLMRWRCWSCHCNWRILRSTHLAAWHLVDGSPTYGKAWVTRSTYHCTRRWRICSSMWFLHLERDACELWCFLRNYRQCRIALHHGLMRWMRWGCHWSWRRLRRIHLVAWHLVDGSPTHGKTWVTRSTSHCTLRWRICSSLWFLHHERDACERWCSLRNYRQCRSALHHGGNMWSSWLHSICCWEGCVRSPSWQHRRFSQSCLKAVGGKTCQSIGFMCLNFFDFQLWVDSYKMCIHLMTLFIFLHFLLLESDWYDADKQIVKLKNLNEVDACNCLYSMSLIIYTSSAAGLLFSHSASCLPVIDYFILSMSWLVSCWLIVNHIRLISTNIYSHWHL